MHPDGCQLSQIVLIENQHLYTLCCKGILHNARESMKRTVGISTHEICLDNFKMLLLIQFWLARGFSSTSCSHQRARTLFFSITPSRTPDNAP